MFTILLVMSLSFSVQAYAWSVTADFESGTVGAKAEGTSGFEYVDRGVFSKTVVHSGNKSAEFSFPAGVETTQGQFFTGGSGFKEGHEIWYRAYFYFPSGWSWKNSQNLGSVIKMMRIRTNSNHLSVFAGTPGDIIYSNEVADVQSGNGSPVVGTNWDIGRWQCMEFYVKLSATNPISRIWKDGVLLYEDTTSKTIPANGSVTNPYILFGNWNNGSPKQQYAYVDDIIITDVTPSQIDSKGNPMIGPTNGNPAPASIQSPTGLRVVAN
jgi:hypothetical protein